MASSIKNLSDFSNIAVPNGAKYTFAIVVAAWNAAVTDALYQGALNTLLAHGVKQKNITAM